MNGGFRGLLGRRDTSRFKAFLLAIAVQMFFLSLLRAFNVLNFWMPPFYPLAVTLGGFLFGLAMNWSGGCPAGVWYKFGSGNLGALAAIVGLTAGYVIMQTGFLRPWRVAIQSALMPRAMALDLSNMVPFPLWMLAFGVSLVLLFVLLHNAGSDMFRPWAWPAVGMATGLIGTAAWVISSLYGRNFGMAILPGSESLAALLLFQPLKAVNWDLLFVLGIPMGSLVAARASGAMQRPGLPVRKAARHASGGFVLGATGSLAGGCTVGHGLAAIPLLSLSSILFILFAILGAWFGLLLERRKS